jgi:hypothetical protein
VDNTKREIDDSCTTAVQEADYFTVVEPLGPPGLISTPFVKQPFAVKPMLPPPGPIAEVTHAPAGSPPRYVRRHWQAEPTITKRGTVARRVRKSYARINRMAKGARP